MLIGGVCLLYGDYATSLLDLDPVAVLEKGQWYRLFTYMYVHGGVTHYINNMIMLYMAGQILEPSIGRGRYALLYHLLGVIAGAGSLLYKVVIGSVIPSVGASGAIMGLMGIIVYISIRNVRFQQRGGINRIMILIFCVFCSIYQGFMVPGVDNAARIAGMADGIFAGLIWELMIRRREKK